MNREGQDLRRAFGIFCKVGGRCERFRYTVAVVYVQVEIHDPRTPSFDAGLGEQHDPQYYIGDITESTCSAALCVMPASIPIDSDVGFAVREKLTSGTCRCSHQGYVV
jgi:hypothetical protein